MSFSEPARLHFSFEGSLLGVLGELLLLPELGLFLLSIGLHRILVELDDSDQSDQSD